MKTDYLQAEVETFARKDFNKADAEMLSSIAMVEGVHWIGNKIYSSTIKLGDLHLMDEVVNGVKPFGPSVGWFQIRTEVQPPSKYVDYDWLYGNPVNQVLAARHKYETQGWKAWTTWRNGDNKAYLQNAVYNPKPVVPASMHLISGGDTLSGIAAQQKYREFVVKFTWQDLALANNMAKPYLLSVGKYLKLPVWKRKIVSGDTLGQIVENETHVKLADVVKLNKIQDPNKISVGQIVYLPDPSFLED